ncbi:MAG: M17 family metallopeptidase [Saprospiraceae bacterium]
MIIQSLPTTLPSGTITFEALASSNPVFTGLDALRFASAKTPGGIAAKQSGPDTFYIGLGETSVKTAVIAGRTFGKAIDETTSSNILVDLSTLGTKDSQICAFLRGIWLATNLIGLWKEEKPATPLAASNFFIKTQLDSAIEKQVLAKAEAQAAGQLAAMHLVDRPANAKRPADVANYVLELGAKHGFEVEVLDEEALEIQGFSGILEVGRASTFPPRLLKLHYKGGSKYHLGLVGKGITFDTGGISIKPSQNLGFMKSDLGGAAAVLGAFISVAKLGLPVEIHGLLAVAENAVAGDAYLPSDVIRNYGGKTIEITDTDAEGRLVMADALAYMPEWCTPDLTMDIATLTGSAVRTFGYECAALFTHKDELVRNLRVAGERCAERTWPLPLWDEYEADLHSDVADIKHFHGKPIAGAINAAKFLEYFVAEKQNWAHLDIAGVAFGNSPFSKDRAGTGFGVSLLTEFLIDRTHE